MLHLHTELEGLEISYSGDRLRHNEGPELKEGFMNNEREKGKQKVGKLDINVGSEGQRKQHT